MTRSAPAAAAVVAVAFLAFHVPYLPASLEDLDSINFALGLRHYDVANHQPHPPGYPVFIAAGHVTLAIAHRVQRCHDDCEAKALGAVGITAGALGVFAIFVLVRELERIANGPTHASSVTSRAGDASEPAAGKNADRSGRVWIDRTHWIAWAAALLASTSPLYWFTAARPLSDTVGLAAAIGVQAWSLMAATETSLMAAAFAAGVATGIRSQVAWLTVPLLAWAAWHRHRLKSGAPLTNRSGRVVRSAWSWVWPFAGGCFVWAIPLLALTGGPLGYWRTLFNQGAEDLTGVQMLWTTPTPRVFVSALYYAFVAPWALWSVAIVVIVFALLGTILLARYWRPGAVVLAIAFVPYLFFDLLFQETFTTRYALPLVVPMAYLAVRGAAAFGWRAAIAVAVVLSAYDAHIGGTSIAAYSRAKAPAFRMLEDMRAASPPAPVLAMDRREQLDMRRPIVWFGNRAPRIAQRLPSPPQHEWLQMVDYWNGGGRTPVWFVADPLRTDIQLVQHSDPLQYRWPVPYPVLLGGVRPNEMDWYQIPRPDWYVSSGWSLTPESAGVSQLDRRGLEHAPLEAWVSTSVLTGGAAFAIGGRNFDPTARPEVTMAWGNRTLGAWTISPGAFLKVGRLPVVTHEPLAEYQRVTIAAKPEAAVAIEQFDVALPGRVVFGYGDGWNEQEYNPYTGKRWRWLSERGELAVMGSRRPVRLHLEGESPKVYFSRPSRLTVRVGNKVAFDDLLSEDFALDITIPGEFVSDFGQKTSIVLETDQVYVPAERSSRTRDRRHLGLRVFKCDLRVVG